MRHRVATCAFVVVTIIGVGAAPAWSKKPHHKDHTKHHAEITPTPTPTPAAKPEEKVEQVEAVEAVEPTADQKTATPGAAGAGGADSPAPAKQDEPLGWFGIAAHLHSAMVHLPIAWLMLLLLTDLAAWGLGRRELTQAGLYLNGLALLSFIPAVATGLLRLTQLPQDPQNLEPAVLHRNIMYGCAALTAVLLGLRLLRKNELTGAVKWLYLALLALTVALVSLGGHLGGKLVFGDDFLPF